MLAAMPEKVRFSATNYNTLAVTEEIHYTGKYKLALLISTSSDLTKPLQDQKFHTVREFGDLLSFGSSIPISISVHYAKLRREEALYLASSAAAYLDDDNAVNNGSLYDE